MLNVKICVGVSSNWRGSYGDRLERAATADAKVRVEIGMAGDCMEGDDARPQSLYTGTRAVTVR
jgi:hypothetical protein